MKETEQSKSCSSGPPFVSLGKPYVYYLQLWANHCQRRDCKRKQQSKVLGTLQCSARGKYCFGILPLLLQKCRAFCLAGIDAIKKIFMAYNLFRR